MLCDRNEFIKFRIVFRICKHIARCLSINQTLRSLNLTNNSMNKGTKLIAEALLYDKKKQEKLNISSDEANAGESSIFYEDIEESRKTKLQELILRANSAAVRVREDLQGRQLSKKTHYWICCFGPFEECRKAHDNIS